MIAILNQYLTYIKWVVLLSAMVSSFWAGHHFASTACDAEKAKLITAQLEQQTKIIEKVRYVYTKNASLPAGAASSKLFNDWSRK